MAIELSRDEIRIIYRQGEEAVVSLIETLMQRLNALEKEVADLKTQGSKDSHNSSKPPSSDIGKRVPRSLRGKSGRHSGGQPGHPGWTLNQVENPDHIVCHSLDGRCSCGRSLRDIRKTKIIRRQVFDIPLPKFEVTEHQVQTGVCRCGKRHVAVCPEHVSSSPVQYGNTLKALVLYLTSYQLVPLKRTQEFFADVFRLPLSQATVRHIAERAHKKLESTEKAIQASIRASPVIHVDETRLTVEGKHRWLHSCGTEKFTLYWCHEKRSTAAMEEAGVLPEYTGRAVHDYWYPYFQFGCRHALCNAHHLRELTFFFEELKQQWAGKMIQLLQTINRTVKRAKVHQRSRISPATRQAYLERYHSLLQEGYETNPTPPIRRFPDKRGRRQQHPARNLLDRFQKHIDEVLAFMDDFSVPFDNNAAERDIRMVKVQQKISGGFRSSLGAKTFCRIRSYIASVRKHEWNVLEFLIKLFNVTDNNLVLIPE